MEEADGVTFTEDTLESGNEEVFISVRDKTWFQRTRLTPSQVLLCVKENYGSYPKLTVLSVFSGFIGFSILFASCISVIVYRNWESTAIDLIEGLFLLVFCAFGNHAVKRLSIPTIFGRRKKITSRILLLGTSLSLIGFVGSVTALTVLDSTKGGSKDSFEENSWLSIAEASILLVYSLMFFFLSLIFYCLQSDTEDGTVKLLVYARCLCFAPKAKKSIILLLPFMLFSLLVTLFAFFLWRTDNSSLPKPCFSETSFYVYFSLSLCFLYVVIASICTFTNVITIENRFASQLLVFMVVVSCIVWGVSGTYLSFSGECIGAMKREEEVSTYRQINSIHLTFFSYGIIMTVFSTLCRTESLLESYDYIN
mmetsp:Transcript_14952/g.18127  ORF Transcript_14952/g.18127 Transcript_14952/m.18127 type:complete len:367 (-) Transcript_14952:776-1876(-)